MPGLAGFTSLRNLSPQELDTRLQALKRNMTIPKDHLDQEILFGPQTAGTIVCPKWKTNATTFQNQTGLVAWFDGDIFNRETLCAQNNWSFESDIEFLVSVVVNPDHQRALKNIDGLFAVVILDTYKNQLHIITDRYGLRPLYWYESPDSLNWATEPKAFLNFPGLSPTINIGTTKTFLATGQLPPNQTWFEGVQQVPPATHLIYHTDTGTLTRERYWWWDQLSTRVAKTDKDDLIQEFGHLFQDAVTSRTRSRNPGLMLSGGLDSRAVFAALPGAPPTFTFGQTNSEEVRIATDVASIKLAPHTVLPLTPDNWLQPRLEAVWWTDGALNLMHMHGVEHFETIGHIVNTCFNGAGGDGLAGAGHLFETHELHQYLSQNLHINLEGQDETRQHIEKAFQNAKSAHAFYIDWRMRGFTIQGPRMGLFTGVDYSLPFLDNALQEFLFGLPLAIKQGNKLYRQMLLKTFPTYFKDIPWAKTGKPVSWPKWALRSAKALHKIQRKPSQAGFTNYPDWLRSDTSQKVIEKLLNTSQAQMHHVISDNSFSKLWAEHLAGQDHSEMIGRFITLEIYLRQVFDKDYRTTEDTQDLFSH